MRTRGEEEEAEIGNKYLCFPPLSLPFRHPCADRIAIPSSPFGSFGSPLQSHASKSTEKKHPRFKKNTQQQSEPTTRRSTLAAGAAIASALAAALVPASPAQAFLGFGGASKDDQYATDTVSK